MSFEYVLVGKPNQIKKSFTQLWLLWTGNMEVVVTYHPSVVISAGSPTAAVVSGSRLQSADGFGDRSHGRAEMMYYVLR